MSEEPFLILHRVRGEPAFDIAIKIQIGAEDETQPEWIEEAWIIPTSGHRAYPYWWSEVEDLSFGSNPDYFNVMQAVPPMPPDWPDHYPAKPDKSKPLVSSLLTKLGLGPKPIKRRI